MDLDVSAKNYQQSLDVLVPKVYLHSNSPAKLTATGALISASNVVMDLKDSLQNDGTIAANNKLVVKAPTLTVGTNGQLTGNAVGLYTTEDMTIQGNIMANQKAVLQSDKDIHISTAAYDTYHADGSHRTDIDRVAGVAVRGDEGVLIVSAKGNLAASGAQLVNLGKTGATILDAGKQLTLDTIRTDNSAQHIYDAQNYMKNRQLRDVGTTIQSNGDIFIQAKQDVSAKVTYVNSEAGAVNLVAGQDILLNSGKENNRSAYGLKYKESGTLSSSTTTIKQDTVGETVEGTTLSSQTTNVVAGRDIHAQSANILGTGDVTVAAGNKILTSTTAKQDYAEDYKSVKKSGLLSAGGIGFMIGTKKTTDAASEDANTTVGSVIGSTEGNVTIQANDTVQLKKANVLAKNDIAISGSDVTLAGDTNTRASTTLHEVKTSGITVALGGTVMSAVNTAIDLKNHAKDRTDKRLAALEYLEAEQELAGARRSINDYRSLEANMRKAAEAEKEYGKTLLASKDESERQLGQQKIDHADKQLADLDGDKKALKAKQKAEIDKLVNVSISIGSSSSKSETKVQEITYEGGKLVAGNAFRYLQLLRIRSKVI